MNLETLEDGIVYCTEEAAEYRWKASLYDTDDEYEFVHAHICEERAEDYSQLAAWLTELKNRREVEEIEKRSMEKCDKCSGVTDCPLYYPWLKE